MHQKPDTPPPPDTQRDESVLVAMSGGVDSSVTALILSNSGYDVIGFTCKMFDPELLPGQGSNNQPSEDAQSAKSICEGINSPHHTFDCHESFEHNVIARFVTGFDSGRTPNPCIDCNRYVKFGDMHRQREELGLDYLATGHYARIRFDGASGRWQLLRAKDKSKDQSYVLYMLTQYQLAHTLFPLGDLTKEEVRTMAVEAGLPCASKPDSQDICFVPDGDYAGFIERWMASRADDASCLEPGPIEDLDGKVLGMHRGISRYTIGQRKGIGIAARHPLYVVEKDASRNALVVGPKERLMTRGVDVGYVNFVGACEDEFAGDGMRVMAKCSYRQSQRGARARFADGVLRVEFEDEVTRVAPGQAVVLYGGDSGDIALAGGTAV